MYSHSNAEMKKAYAIPFTTASPFSSSSLVVIFPRCVIATGVIASATPKKRVALKVASDNACFRHSSMSDDGYMACGFSFLYKILRAWSTNEKPPGREASRATAGVGC